ncbi:hypothetical protein KAR28_04590 [Candidatus Parcubacteria bacterium]|nr:hypothetical protein [Candidatus Parcubacteria bacterium]
MAKQNKIWRKNFEVKRAHYQIATPAIFDMMHYQHITVGRIIMRELVWVQKDYDNIGSYVPIDQLRKLVEATMDVIQKNPRLIENIHKKTIGYNRNYFNYAKSILKINLSQLSNSQLSEIYEKLIWHQKITHGYALPTTWFFDSDGEDFSKFLINKIKKIIKKQKSKLNSSEVFSLLTTPEISSMAVNEEIESLKILQKINNNKEAKDIFLQHDVEKIENDLKKIDDKLKKKIIGHYKKWCWYPFTYIGPVYELNYYFKIWSGLLRENINIDKNLEKIKNQSKKIKLQKKRIIKELKIDFATMRLFNIASEIIYLKSYRKDCLFHGMYVLDKILREISSRFNFSLKQVRFMADWEVTPALKKGDFPVDVLNERIKFSVYYQKGEKGVIYTGAKARQFLSKLNIEKIKIKKVDKLEGTCACPGKVAGVVKIVNLPEEMGKMNQDDVMVAHTTFPSLVPAMKKAIAIVTDDGGITCHAAIVAREMNKPCVIGTKIATQILKDGDKIEVDADKGIVKILKKQL